MVSNYLVGGPYDGEVIETIKVEQYLIFPHPRSLKVEYKSNPENPENPEEAVQVPIERVRYTIRTFRMNGTHYLIGVPDETDIEASEYQDAVIRTLLTKID